VDGKVSERAKGGRGWQGERGGEKGREGIEVGGDAQRGSDGGM